MESASMRKSNEVAKLLELTSVCDMPTHKQLFCRFGRNHGFNPENARERLNGSTNEIGLESPNAFST
jgi:hypothetical protein